MRLGKGGARGAYASSRCGARGTGQRGPVPLGAHGETVAAGGVQRLAGGTESVTP